MSKTGYSPEMTHDYGALGSKIRYYYSTSYNAATNVSTVTIVPQLYSDLNLGSDIRMHAYRDRYGNMENAGVRVDGSTIWSFNGGYQNSRHLSASGVNWNSMSASTGETFSFSRTHDNSGNFSVSLGIVGALQGEPYDDADQSIYEWPTGVTVTVHEDRTLKVSYNANGGSGAPSATYFYGTTESITLSSTKPSRANGSAGSYTVTFNYNGNGASNTTASASRTAKYTFNKWNTKSDGTGTAYTAGQSIGTRTSDLTLYAQWTSTTTTAAVTLPTPTRTGYTFAGWYTAASGGTKAGNGGASYTPAGNITLYAHWTAITYTVSYNANGGSSTPASQTKTHGVALTLASAITKANASAGSYTVTYNYNGSGAANTTANAARTTSYTFKNWSTALNGGTAYNAGASYTANASATMYAQWAATTTTAAVTLPTPTRSGYTFAGWYTAASGGTSKGNGGASFTPTGDITLYAQWTALASTIASRSASVETTNSLALTVNRNSTSYYHKATFKIGSTVLATSTAFATSLSYPVPRTWFNSYPNDTSKTVTVSVQTFTTSACTTTVGSPVTTTFTMKADAGMKPTVSSGWATHAYDNTGTAAANIVGYVKGYSKATISFDTSKITMANNATIRSYSIKCQDVTVSASPYRTPVLTSTSAAVVCTVTDSRGRTASGTLTIPVMNYAPPRLSDISVFRCDGDGNADPDGTSYSVRAIRTYSPLPNQNGTYQNSCTLQVRLGSSANPYYDLTSGVATRKSGISADVTYLVTIKATDALNNSVFYYAQIPSRKWAMKFRPTGNGVAFGKAAEYDNTFEVTPDWAVKLGQPLPVTSGGTGASTVAAARANLGAFYLGMTTALVAGNDLNNFTTAGSYYSTSSTVSAGISNTPTTAQGYRLDVIVTSNVNYPTQIAVCYNGDIYRRSLVVINNVDTWKSWEKVLTGTAAIADGGTGATTASAALSNLGGLPSVTLTNMTANTTAALLSALNADISAVPTGASVVRCGNSSNAYRCLLLVIRASTTLGKAISISSYSALHNISLSLGSSGWAVG